MSSQSFTQKPTSALPASAVQTQAWAEKQQLIGQLFSQIQQAQTHMSQTTVLTNGNANTMTATLPHTTLMQDVQTFSVAVEAPQAIAAVVPVAGVEIAEPCMPQAPAQTAQPVQAMEQDLLWHAQELLCGPETNITLLPCLGLFGDDIDFPGAPEPGSET